MSSTGSSRGNPSMGDVVRSVAVLSALVLALWGFGQLFTNTPDTPVKPIDYAATVKSARPAAQFELLAPSALPKGWAATSAKFTPQTWHLGVVTDEEEYLGLEQRKVDAKELIAIYAKGSKADGTATISGESWNVRTGPDGDTTFVRTKSGLSTLVTGEAPRAEVEAYVSSLSAS